MIGKYAVRGVHYQIPPHIDADELRALAERLVKSGYGDYLLRLADSK